jgi:hypothetical protein
MSQETCHLNQCSFGRGALKQFGAEGGFSLPEFPAGSRRAVCTPANALIALRRTQGAEMLRRRRNSRQAA